MNRSCLGHMEAREAGEVYEALQDKKIIKPAILYIVCRTIMGTIDQGNMFS